MAISVLKDRARKENPMASGKKAARKKKVAPADKPGSKRTFSSELSEPQWSVVTFEKLAASGLTYDEAVIWAEKLAKQGANGICIVTDRAASHFNS